MRRTVDITVSVIAILALMPVMILIAVGILCTAGAPVLFRQERWGLGGCTFVIWKFRTLRPPAFPGEPDIARLFGFGGFLRASSLDELPQLWNILRGDMSLIGPRPLPLDLGREIARSPRQSGRLAIRPGLTGWAQVRGRNELPLAEKVEQDLWYVLNRSLRVDLLIIALTAVQIVRPRGIYAAAIEGPHPEVHTPAPGPQPHPRDGIAQIPVAPPGSTRDRTGLRTIGVDRVEAFAGGVAIRPRPVAGDPASTVELGEVSR